MPLMQLWMSNSWSVCKIMYQVLDERIILLLSLNCSSHIMISKSNLCLLFYLYREGVIPSNVLDADLVECTDHMCPLRIHWHIKNNYVSHWKVKVTVSNYHYGRNYSDWNVVIQHPGFGQPSASSGFNSTMLPSIGIPGTPRNKTLTYKPLSTSRFQIQELGLSFSSYVQRRSVSAMSVTA